MKLSIIVPIYNVEPYLRKCVDSLLMQDYDDYEIILVDDGSPDGCPQICDEYASRLSPLASRLRVIHQPNAGISVARNTGIEAAQGEYVCFVDSDDFWEPNVLGALMAQVERDNLDVLRFDYQNVKITEKKEYTVFEPNKYSRVIDTHQDIVSGKTYLDKRMGYACYAVMFIMRREIVPLFKKNIHYEDVEWLPRMMLSANSVTSTKTIVYNYLLRPGSITHEQGNKFKQKENIDDKMRVIGCLSQLSNSHFDCQWLRNMRSNMAVGVLTSVARYFYTQRKTYIHRLRALGVFPLSIADQGKTYVRRARLLTIFGARIYCVIMNLHCKIRSK